MASESSQRQVLDDDQLNDIGRVFSALLLPGADWIHRRRESVRVVDETALKRQISVDFTLPEELRDGSPLPDIGGLGFPAPIFVLPKAPKKLMSFDMVNANGRSLPLMTSSENRGISAAALVAMANAKLGEIGLGYALSPSLQTSLEEVAKSDVPNSEELANELFDAERRSAVPPDLEHLLADERFCFWLSTLSHSSIIPVWCLDDRRREIVKLSFREPISYDLPMLGKLGLSPYELSISSSYIEAQNHHFEAVAPHGMRIAQARLASDSDNDGHGDGLLRRLHLYLPGSERAGGALAKVDLRVSARGFLRDAWLPALLVTGCLGGAWFRAEEIVSNPNSSPALFLLLPGLIATYLSRPDRHALTSRLLSAARIVLMATALFAFIAAGSVAFLGPASANPTVINSRTEDLEALLCVLFVLSGLATALLFFARGRASHNGKKALRWLKDRTLGWVRSWRQLWSGRFSFVVESEMNAEDSYREMERTVQAALPKRNLKVLKERPPFEYELVRPTDGPASLHLEIGISRIFRGSRITCEGWGPGADEQRFPGWRMGVWWMGLRMWREIRRRLRQSSAKGTAIKIAPG